MTQPYIKPFCAIGISDIPEVGGKNASLGEMIQHFAPLGITIPDGFAITVSAYRYFIGFNLLAPQISGLLDELDEVNFSNLSAIGTQIRQNILGGSFPSDLTETILKAVSTYFNSNQEVAVRSSATAEDLAEASFAGQHDSFLNVKGKKPLPTSPTFICRTGQKSS